MADKIRINKKYDLNDQYQPSDSEDDYSPEDKKLLQKVRKKNAQQSESEEEVYGFSPSEDESNNGDDYTMADSDVEGQEKSDDDLPDSKAWGKKKKSYYSADYVDQDYGGFGEEQEEEAAMMEEQEAKNIQRRLLEQLADDDFSLDFFNKKSEEVEDKDTVIKSDIGQLSKRQKMQLLEKESPELMGLIDDFKTKLTVAKDDLKPVLNLIKNGQIPECPASKFVKTNYDLILNYCTNISFYMLLKSKKISIQNHPVVKRLYQYRQMLNKIEPIYVNVIKPQINNIKTSIENNAELVIVNDASGSKKRKSDKLPEMSSKKLKLIKSMKRNEDEESGVSDNEDEYEKEGFQARANSDSDESGFSDDNINEEENEKDEPTPSTSAEVDSLVEESANKREITYQIAKNKGLTPHRKKEQRNPRVKHKLKFRKAKIRRKGAIREVKKELSRYGGEVSGIKANVKKSVKIK